MAKTAGSVSANFCDGVSSSITRITQDVFAITVTGGAFRIWPICQKSRLRSRLQDGHFDAKNMDLAGMNQKHTIRLISGLVDHIASVIRPIDRCHENISELQG